MKKSIISLVALPLAMIAATSCNEIVEPGTIDFEQWKAEKEANKDLPVYTNYTLNHPCLLHSKADIEYVKQNLSQEPYASALVKLKNSQYANTAYNPNPVLYLARLDATNWGSNNTRWQAAGISDLWYEGIHNNYTNFMRDAAAAYQLSLLYVLEGNTSAADAAVKILNAWSTTNKGLLRNTSGQIVDPNEKLILFQPYQVATAAELLRDYPGWSENEFRQFVKWLEDSFYAEAHGQLELQNNDGGGHYWWNWDLAALSTILSIGILSDNQDYINEALMYQKGLGGGPGNIYNGVVYLHDDPDSDEVLGQGNELGRDQGHNTLCVSLLGVMCQMANTIGEDLYAFADYRAFKFIEYVAKYNLAYEDRFPDPMQNFSAQQVGNPELNADFEYSHNGFPFTTYTYGDGGTMVEPSKAGRGTVRPGWDYFVGYANTHNVPAKYASQFAERIRPDGGGGHYSGNSGGFDQIGFSTLMGYRPAN